MLNSFQLSLPGFVQICGVVPQLTLIDSCDSAQSCFSKDIAVVIYKCCAIFPISSFVVISLIRVKANHFFPKSFIEAPMW